MTQAKFAHYSSVSMESNKALTFGTSHRRRKEWNLPDAESDLHLELLLAVFRSIRGDKEKGKGRTRRRFVFKARESMCNPEDWNSSGWDRCQGILLNSNTPASLSHQNTFALLQRDVRDCSCSNNRSKLENEEHAEYVLIDIFNRVRRKNENEQERKRTWIPYRIHIFSLSSSSLLLLLLSSFHFFSITTSRFMAGFPMALVKGVLPKNRINIDAS